MKWKNITQFFVSQPTLFWSLVVAILLSGLWSFMRMPKLEDPAVAVKQASVVVVYPGATAKEVESKVAQTMEDHLRTLPDVEEIRTDCEAGYVQFTVEFKMSVLKKDLEQHFDLLRRKVTDARPYLPQGCYDPIVVDDMMDVYGLFYALVGDRGYSYDDLEHYAKLIRRELLAVDGVKRVNIVGTRPEEIQIDVNKDRLAQNGLLPTQLMTALQQETKVVNAGKYDDDGCRINLRVAHELKNDSDVANLLIKTPAGKTLRLGDVATIRRHYQEPQTNGFFVNGKPAIAICIALQDNVVVPDVGKAVDARLAKVMPRVPVGMTTQKIFFQPDKVNEAISSFMVNLLESVAIVIIVLMFTMGFRSGLIIGFGLVLTIAMSFPILLTMGTTLQRISLGAFIIAMGMLVDNAIVIMDGILVDKQRGLGPKTYLYRIGQNTAMPLLGATIIAVSTFIAVYMSPDSAGEYCRDMFLVLCVSLLSSWLIALVQVPACAKMWLPVRSHSKDGNLQTVPYSSPVHRMVRQLITTLIGHKVLTISAAVMVLLLSVFGMKYVKNLFFPDFDYSQFIVEYRLPTQSSPDRVRHDLLEMTGWLKKNPLIDRVSATMGNAPAHYCLVRPMTTGGDCYGELMVDCKDFKTCNKVIAQIKDRMRQRYPDAYIRFRHYNFSISTTHPVEVQFCGPDPAVLRQLAGRAEDIMRRAPHVDHYSVENNWKPMGKCLMVDYVKQNAALLGVGRGTMTDALLAATDGLPVGALYDGDKIVPIDLRMRRADGTAVGDLHDVPVWSLSSPALSQKNVPTLMASAGKMDAVKSQMLQGKPMANVVTDIRPQWEEQCILRVNGERCIEAECDPETSMYQGTVAKVMSEVKDSIDNIPLPDGYSRYWAGEGKTSNKSVALLMKYLPLTVLIILTILLLLFRNWKETLLILCCIPFVICGITPTLLLFRQPFTFMAIIGLMGLMGMMVKNAIVLVDEINRLIREEKAQPYQAVIAATVSRVRPVIMASLTTILGMAPLLGDPMYGSMAVCIMSGLTVGTLITLVLLPILYASFYRVKRLPAENHQ